MLEQICAGQTITANELRAAGTLDVPIAIATSMRLEIRENSRDSLTDQFFLLREEFFHLIPSLFGLAGSFSGRSSPSSTNTSK
jgi:hypothetical protein